MNKKLLINLIVFTLIFIAFSVNSVYAQEKIDILFASGSPGGAWYALGGSLAEIINQDNPNILAKSVPGSGSFGNVLRIGNNEAQLGLTFPSRIAEALSHTGQYAEREKLEEGTLLTLFGGIASCPLQFTITTSFAEKYGIETVKDLIDKKVPIRIATTMPGMTEAWAIEVIFEFYGASLEDLQSLGSVTRYGGYSDCVESMKDGHADLIVVDINPPASALVEIMVSRKLKVLPLTEEAIDFMAKTHLYTPTVIPAGTYKGQDSDVPTATMYTAVITNNKVPEEIAYSMMKTLIENKEKVQSAAIALSTFNPETSWKGLAAPLHPGAERAYKEFGYIK